MSSGGKNLRENLNLEKAIHSECTRRDEAWQNKQIHFFFMFQNEVETMGLNLILNSFKVEKAMRRDATFFFFALIPGLEVFANSPRQMAFPAGQLESRVACCKEITCSLLLMTAHYGP